MRNIITRIGQRILKNKKRLIYGALVFFISQICFFGIGEFGIENQVFADNNDSQEIDMEKDAQKRVNTLSFIQKMIYILIYPMLVIAGTLVDNSMVYGEFFNFDVVLRELWNMMRNLANYTLGFIFIYKIFKYIIGDQKPGEIKKLLIGLLIAGVGIQASWFIMSALVDASTILTYSVGGLPITLLKENENDNNKGTDVDPDRVEAAQQYGYLPNGNGADENPTQTTSEEGGESCTDKDSSKKYNPYVYKTVITLDVEEEDTSAIRMYLTNTVGEHIYISECSSFKYTGAHEILLAPSVIYYSYYENGKQVFKSTEKNLCHYGGQVYQFSEGPLVSFEGCGEKDECKRKQKEYTSELGEITKKLRDSTKEYMINNISAGKLLEEGNAHATGGIQGALRNGQYPSCKQGLDVDNMEVGAGKTKRLQDALDDKSYLGVFSQLYTSLMTSGRNIVGSKGNSWFLSLLSVVLELGHLIAIAIPLIVVGIIFMIRIGILWIAIILSPFIAILTAFEDDIGKFVFEKMKDVKIFEYLKLTNLIGIIFSPVVICLAVSLSTVFVTIISNVDFNESFGNERNEILGGLIKINIANVSVGIWRFLRAFIGAAITWYIVWAAIQSSKLGEMKFVESLKDLASTSIGTIPIIPIPTKDGGTRFIGANTAFGLNHQDGIIKQISNKLKTEYDTQENRAVNSLFGEGTSEEDVKALRADAYKKNLSKIEIKEGTSWINQPVTIGEKGHETQVSFGSFDDAGKKSIIDGINEIDSEERRQAFGGNTPEVKIGDDTYVFNKSDDKNKFRYIKKQEESGQNNSPSGGDNQG